MEALSTTLPPLLDGWCQATVRRAWIHSASRALQAASAIAAASCLLPTEAKAHIKWFGAMAETG